MTIVEFLTARLDEDTAAARAATPGRWLPEGKSVSDSDGIEFVEATRRDVSHIARHDPARVLREVAAKRRLLELHTPDGGYCTTCLEDESDIYGRTYEEAPCLNLRLVASSYSDHPDYQQEWAP